MNLTWIHKQTTITTTTTLSKLLSSKWHHKTITIILANDNNSTSLLKVRTSLNQSDHKQTESAKPLMVAYLWLCKQMA